MPRFEAGQVVRVPFPYSDGTPRHHRPALIVATVGTDEAPFLLWVLMITSSGNRPWPGDIGIPDLGAAGLPAPSIIRTAKIATIEATHAETIGLVSEAIMVAVRTALDARLSLSNQRPHDP